MISTDKPLEVGTTAPLFSTHTTDNILFKLQERTGKWTVLYFYPKDDTPGCTNQACAFRDTIDLIRKQNAEVYGISQDNVASHKKFTEKYQLNFLLLADTDGKISRAYGTDGVLGFSKRWTFIIDPARKIRWLQKDVDPAYNAKEVAMVLEQLQKSAK